ncbi:uncharacterized protein LOC142977055 [Anticarsia gemmatalis]|uniref:uncharacterized protein LOC142977055 n=1 Tax=Anticarsia gemmatalis TaxID=129554 RepID=UPI003F761F44
MIKHAHNHFQSDIFLILETVGAQVTIMDWHGNKQTCTMQGFLKEDMKGRVLYNILLPPLTDSYELITYKLMPRAQSAHAIVNCGFLYKLNKTTYVVEEARIVYSALSANFLRATATEAYLVGKSLFTNETLQAALKVLDGELVVEPAPPEPSVEYRKHVAKALFFKGLLTLCPSSNRAARFESGTVRLHESRGLSSAKQTYTTDPSLYPVNQPITKAEALYQCAGEALYTDDIPAMKNEVYAAFVLSTVALGTIVKIDASKALALDGVIEFYTAKDIPGLNSFTPADSMLYGANEEILCDGNVKFYHQPIGIIVAETQVLADRAAKLVTVKYSNVRTPVVDIKKAKTDSARNKLFYSIDASNAGSDVHKIITGDNTFYGQYHFTMETMATVAKPTEEGIEVHSATQWLDGTHVMISRALGVEQNKIDMILRRIGGGYGMKISRSIQSAIACSLVCYKLDRPCRFIQPLTTNMKALGKRMPCVNEYEVAVNNSGVIQYINHTIYEDNGYKINETLTALGVDVFYNCYDVKKYNFKAYDTITDNAKNTWCRAPGTVEAIAACEYVMERISYELSLDPIAVRLANLDKEKYGEMAEVYEQLKTNAEYVTRRAAVDSFNTQNRWKKRGLRFAFARWAPAGAQRFDINLSVYHGDGSIIITHCGVEMGQGINTKAAQVAAYLLKVPVSKIQVKSNSTTITPNSFISGGSLTTQNVIIGLRRCCEQLQARLDPIKATLTDPTWEELIKAAYNNDVDLQAHGFVGTPDVQEYSVYGIALSEVEIDVLTGEFEILRVDLVQDVGISISPEIDIGQVEGGFMMLVGYWTCEKLQYEDTGKILTDRSWDYHLPEARDIPQNFNVWLRQSASNNLILGSKAVGEPSACAAIGVTFALREAIALARQESGIPTTTWFNIDGPFSTEAVCMATNTSTDDFKFS